MFYFSKSVRSKEESINVDVPLKNYYSFCFSLFFFTQYVHMFFLNYAKVKLKKNSVPISFTEV